MKRTTTTVATTLAALLLPAGAALAVGPDQDVIEATPAFACGPLDAPAPPLHCVNVRSQGDTGLILVFEPDPRGPQEGISFNPRADDRPCPHDPDSPDGTWWQPTDDPFWVCHHRPGRD